MPIEDDSGAAHGIIGFAVKRGLVAGFIYDTFDYNGAGVDAAAYARRLMDERQQPTPSTLADEFPFRARLAEALLTAAGHAAAHDAAAAQDDIKV